MTNDAVYTALKTVLDPELGVNIVDLGLIYAVRIEGDKIHILMTLTTPGCPLGGAIIRMIRDALSVYPEINPERDVSVEVVFDPPWVVDMISEGARAELGL